MPIKLYKSHRGTPFCRHRRHWNEPRATYEFDEVKNTYQFCIELPRNNKEDIRIKVSYNHLKVGIAQKKEDLDKEKVIYKRRFDFY